jgi:hypothetical protein
VMKVYGLRPNKALQSDGLASRGPSVNAGVRRHQQRRSSCLGSQYY